VIGGLGERGVGAAGSRERELARIDDELLGEERHGEGGGVERGARDGEVLRAPRRLQRGARCALRACA
jgi:hypothetical protein